MAFATSTQPGVGASASGYRTAPDQETTGWPAGVPYIVGNEACERFSYYGMRAILYAHLVLLYLAAAGVPGQTDESVKDLAEAIRKPAQDNATATVHLFFAGAFALPMIGAIISDRLLGKYRTIFYLSLVYCAGQAVLAFGEQSLTGMYIGLALIAIGAGGIKPCVSANVGDQFGKNNWFRVRTVFQIFYFSINVGSSVATLLIPITRAYFGPAVAFAIPGVLMGTATFIFWLGRKQFVHVPPKPGGKLGLLDTFASIALFMAVGHFFFTSHSPWWVMLLATVAALALGLTLVLIRQWIAPEPGFIPVMIYTLGRIFRAEVAAPSVNGDEPSWARNRFWRPAVERYGVGIVEGPVAVLKTVSAFFFVSFFWALFDQHSTTWIKQAGLMDLHLWGEVSVKATQVAAFNPILILAFIPLMNVGYACLERRGIQVTTLRRITVGILLAALSFVTVAVIQQAIDARGTGQVWFVWQIIPYIIVTVAEVMVSTTGLEFAYTQAPKAMKSTVMGFWLLCVAFGNVLVAVLANVGNLTDAQSFWFWASVTAVAGVLFGVRAYFYIPKDYAQG